jgi:NAD(P)-dependent dehydrogenase (short-subunit alcohol dehydrogenase family)
MLFSGKTVFITGASRGIGACIARDFRAQGAFVIGTRTSTNSTYNDYCDEWHEADFSSESQILRCADFIKERDVDILINNAGININADFADIDLEVFKSIQMVNLLAPFILSQSALIKMEQKGWGRIVHISSIWGKISKQGRAAYSASKFALDGLTVSLSAEYSQKGILANCIAPGFVDTPLTRASTKPAELKDLISRVPIGRLGEVDEISKYVLWLSSEENTFMTGQNIAIDGGFTRV